MTTRRRSHRAIPNPLDGDAVPNGVLWLTTAPPSLNNIFINVRRGRIKSEEYKGWLCRMHLQLRKQSGWHVPGKIRVRLTFNRAETRADLDNLAKPVLDLLVQAGRIADDRNVIELRSSFGPVKGVLAEVWQEAQTIPAGAFAACSIKTEAA